MYKTYITVDSTIAHRFHQKHTDNGCDSRHLYFDYPCLAKVTMLVGGKATALSCAICGIM